MIRSLIFVILVIIGLGSCDKEPLPADQVESVKYSMELTSDYDTKNLEAGINSHYLYTDYSNWNDRLLFSSSLRPVQCQALCPNTFEVVISSQSMGMYQGIEELLPEGDYAIGRLDSTFILNLTGQIEHQIFDAYRSFWVINEVDTIRESSFSVDLPLVGPIPVCLHLVQDEENAFYKKCYWIEAGVTEYSNVQVNIQIDQQFGTYTVEAVPSGTPPFTYQWSNGASTSSTQFPQTDTSFCVTVTDAEDSKVSLCRTFNGQYVSSGMNNPQSMFQVDSVPTTAIPDDILIRYMNPDGELYTSLEEGNTGNCSLQDFKPAGTNERGDQVYAFSIEFEAPLRNEAGIIRMFSGNGTFAVAVPE